MRRLHWIGLLGVALPLACGITTRDQVGDRGGESPPQAEPPQDEPVEDMPDEGGSASEGGSAHTPGPGDSDAPDDGVEQLVTTLELLRHRAGRCQQKLAGPGAPFMPATGPFFFGDASTGLVLA